MSVASIIKQLERAREYRERYPGLSVKSAIGLTGLDLGSAEQYAPLLEVYNLFDEESSEEIPGEIPDDVRRAVCGRYVRMQENLATVRGFGLDPQDPGVLSEEIERLRPLVVD